jgi:hypothetical protein
MKNLAWVILFLSATTIAIAQENTTATFDANAASRFAKLALACIEKEYPNKISHSLNSDADVAPPRKLTPAFYGCYDWHSSVHGHWLLVRLVRTFPNAPFAAPAREALRRSLTTENLAQEAAYLRATGRTSFERPYGLAWLLQLAAELREWDDPQALEMAANLRPVEQAAIARLSEWLPKLSNPVRIGEHNQTAFGLGLTLDYARSVGDKNFADLITASAKRFYQNDKNCPLEYEPSGEDFLSPCLGEADLMRRVLPASEFSSWLAGFLPQVRATPAGAPPSGFEGRSWLPTVKSPDPSDPKLAHLDGLNLSRAWMLEGIASALPANDNRLQTIRAAAQAHRQAGLAAVTGEHYEGAHWLGTFATYLTTQRFISASVLSVSSVVKSQPYDNHPQSIPGRLQAVRYDSGGEGIAYHDTDTINHGSGELNYTSGHCEEGVPASICHFRENEGVDISYVKKQADLNHPSMVTPEWQQLYIGWTADGEWVNYTVDVKKPGTYRIIVMYSNQAQTIHFDLNGAPAAECTLPVDTWKDFPMQDYPDWFIWHFWNKTQCGQITFPKSGLQVLTLHYNKGNNLAYFDFLHM